jgi:hypothetical protein
MCKYEYIHLFQFMNVLRRDEPTIHSRTETDMSLNANTTVLSVKFLLRVWGS